MENTPLVVDGIMYTGTALEIVALDAVTGREYWKLNRALDPKAYYNAYEVNKGLAIAGSTLFWATVDCHLIAIDAKNGQIIWDQTLADYRKGYQYNVPPLVVRDKVILGPATNEAGANCWVSAHDVRTGKELWRFDTAPASADAPEAKTWIGDSWKHGGSPIWNAGSYDPETNLTFWGTGNPNPGWNGDVRTPADNLYSASVIALDADTGTLKWHYQFTPGDEYDWDATQVPVLADMEWQGKPRKLMLWANRNGFFYVLDRVTGKFLMGKPFVKQTWADGIDDNGRPLKNPEFWPKPMGGIVVFPGRREARTGTHRPTARARGCSMCRRGTTTRRVPRSIPPASGSRGSGTRDRHRLLAWTCRLAAAARPAPTRHSSGRMKGTVRSAHWIRRPARRSGTTGW